MSEAVRERMDSGRSSRSGTSLSTVPSSESSKEEAAGGFLDMDMGRIVRRVSSSSVANDLPVNEMELEWPELPLVIEEMDGGVLSKKVNIGMTALTQSISGCYLEDNGIDSMTQNETQSYISGDTATGVLNFVEGFLAKVNAGAKIAPKCLLQVLEASIFNDHQICLFTVAVRMCNKHLRCYDSDDTALPSTHNDPCHILHFGMRFGDKDQFYCLYYRMIDALLNSGRMVREKFQDGLKFSKLSVPINSVDGDKGLQLPLGISGPPPLPSKLKASRMDHLSEVLVGQPPLAEMLHDMLVGDSNCMQFEGTRVSSLLSSNYWGRSCICASGDSTLKSLMYVLVCLAEDVILRPREGEGAAHLVKTNVTTSHASCLKTQHRPWLGKHHDSFAALFAMRAISSLVRDSRSLVLVDSNIFQSLLALCSFTIFLPSSIDPADGDAGSAASRYWEGWACIEAQMQGALAAEFICQAAQTSVIDDKVLAKGSTTSYEILKAIALCSCPELVPYLSRMLSAWQIMLNKRRPVRELTGMKITPAPYISVVGGGGETTRELPGPVEFRVRGEFPTLFATISRFLSMLDGSQWDDGKPTSKLHADVELQPPHPLWAVTMYIASQYCELNVLICHSSDSETGKEYLVQFQLKSGGKGEFYTFVNRLLQLVCEKTDLMVLNLEGVESKDGLILLSSPHNVPSSTILDGPNLCDGRPYFGDADDSAERLFAAVSGSNESLPVATTRLLLGDDVTRLQGGRLASYLTATQSTQERLCSGAESEIVELVEALVYVAFQKGDDELVDKTGSVSKHRRLFAILALSQMIGGGPNRNVKACNALANTSISIEQAQDCAYAVARTCGTAEALYNVLSCHRLGGKGV